MKLKILHLEDSAADAELVERELNKSNLEYEKKIVSDRHSFVEALFTFSPDIIISDHSLPSFNSVEALEIVKEQKHKAPVILVTATISEEFAADIIKKGAYDYILKDRLQRLPTAILNALEKRRLEEEREKYVREIIESEALFKKAEKIAHFGVWESDLVTGVVKWSDEIYPLLGYKKGEIEPSLQNVIKAMHPDDAIPMGALIQDAIMHLGSLNLDYRVKDKTGQVKYVHSVLLIERDMGGKPLKITGFNEDVTEEMEAKKERDKMLADVIKRNSDLEQFSFIVSHNLRAPLANIMGLIGMLKHGETGNDEFKKIVSGLDSSGGKLENIILDLNDILKIRDSVKDKRETVSFTALVSDIKQLIAKTIEKDDVKIVTDFAQVDTIETVKSFIYSIFYNLIINAINFRQADKPPVIRISSQKKQGKIYLVFEDNGIGMDLAKTGSKIFKLYSRFHESEGGRGMGLYMVKTQVEGLNGKISVASTVNKGTKFTIELEAA